MVKYSDYKQNIFGFDFVQSLRLNNFKIMKKNNLKWRRNG